MEMLLFPLVAIALYFVSDWILLRVEAARGKPFEHRTLVFFAIILVLALTSFTFIRHSLGGF